jgi:nucleotide-binding universal stress UspA family protein
MEARAILEKRGTSGRPSMGKLEIKRVLCPMDFSEFSQCAFRYAASLARHFGSHLLVQHTAQSALNMADSAVHSQIQRSREDVRRLLISNGVDFSDVTILLNEGDPTERILETISRERIDLVVMGTHGLKGFSRLAIGSVTEQLIHLAMCPVLVVSRPIKDFVKPRSSAQIRTIVVATDFSPHSDRALAYATKWGAEWGSKVVLFHAVEKTPSATRGLTELFPEYNPYFERQVAGAWEKASSIVPQELTSLCDVIYEIRHGNPREEILKVAEEKNADLIITGARGSGTSGAPWGSVSSAVVRDGRYPVLVVRELS